MEVLHQPGKCRRPPEGSIVTIGAYDGVHLGHRQLIARVRAAAADRGCASAVVTFDRHPAMVVRPDSAPLLLTDLEQKLELLDATGIDLAVVVHFDEDRSHESAEDFVSEVLVDCLGARAVVVGHDFHFGYRRGGNVALLQTMGADLGFDVTGVTLYRDHPDGTPVSSTRIRRLLADGQVQQAALLLGRFHQVRGTVAGADGSSRDARQYQSATVLVPREIQLPGEGVYAGWYQRADHTRHPAAVSLGRWTGPQGAPLLPLEVHLLSVDDVDHDGEPALVEFVAAFARSPASPIT
jgi:riboflavin kinase/FMN adenylyltransferase